MRKIFRHIRIPGMLACMVICVSCGDSYIPRTPEGESPATDSTGGDGIMLETGDTVLKEDIEDIHIHL